MGTRVHCLIVRFRFASVLAACAAGAFFSVVLRPSRVEAVHVFEVGTGWQDMGALRYDLHWLPAIQGSRKDLPAFFSWRWQGERRVYWAPFARLNYTGYWSIGGGGNALGITLAPAGIGVYLSRPLAEVAPEERRGRWFATVEVNVGLQLGGNVTPGASPRLGGPEVSDPVAYRSNLLEQVATRGRIQADTIITQQYPAGPYQFAMLSMLIQFRIWNMVTRRTGVGFFVEGNGAMFEWVLGGYGNRESPRGFDWSSGNGGTAEPAYGYNVTAGLSVLQL